MVYFRQVFPCLFPVLWCFLAGSIPAGTVLQACIPYFEMFKTQSPESNVTFQKRYIRQIKTTWTIKMYIDNHILQCYAISV
nr:MAG TPA: hypothetical protein [Caudoviricetes sp.]